jgi:Zn-dependent protease with chaperone function
MTVRLRPALAASLFMLAFPMAGDVVAGDLPEPLAPAAVASAEANRALTRALALLPRRPRRVVVIDVSRLGPELQATTQPLDAFVTDRSPHIYVTSHSAVLTRAIKGSRLHTYVLASIIWHEMAHLNGADEAGARLAEEQLWRRFIQDGLVDQVTALGYLKLLEQRDTEDP